MFSITKICVNNKFNLHYSRHKYTAGQLLRTDNTIILSNHKMKGSKMWKIRSVGYSKKKYAHANFFPRLFIT